MLPPTPIIFPNTQITMSIRSILTIAFLLTGSLWAPTAASADVPEEEKGLVLESYVGGRPRDADHLLGPLLDELKQAGYRGSSVVGMRIQSQHSISPHKLNKKDIQNAHRLIKEGHSAFIDSRFEGALSSAGKGLQMLLRRPATMATQQQVRELMYEALMTLSLAHHRLGHKDQLREVMGEYIRSFPDRDVSRRDYGPEGAELYRRIIREMNQHERGELQIAAGAGTMIFINERYAGLGSYKSKLFPGKYRVYTQSGSDAGRVHLVTVPSGGKGTLVVDKFLDATLHTDENFVGYSFANEEQRLANEHKITVALGRALGTKTIIVVGLHKEEGNTYIVATSIATDRNVSGSSARILVPKDSAPSATQLRNLAQYIAGSSPASSSIEVLAKAKQIDDEPISGGTTTASKSGATLHKKSSGNESGISPVWKYVSWTAGAAAIAGGGYLIAINGTGTCDRTGGVQNCPKNFETLPAGIGTVLGGAVLGAAGFYLWGKEAPAKKSINLSILPSDGGVHAAVFGRF